MLLNVKSVSPAHLQGCGLRKGVTTKTKSVMTENRPGEARAWVRREGVTGRSTRELAVVMECSIVVMTARMYNFNRTPQTDRVTFHCMLMAPHTEKLCKVEGRLPGELGTRGRTMSSPGCPLPAIHAWREACSPEPPTKKSCKESCPPPRPKAGKSVA